MVAVVVVVVVVLLLNESYFDYRGPFQLLKNTLPIDKIHVSKIHKGCIPNPECIWPSLGMGCCRRP
jgi:hypothetical protein